MADDEESGLADGGRPDYAWARRLRKLIEDTPLAPTLLEALEPLRAFDEIDVELLAEVVAGKGAEWCSTGHLQSLGLPDSFQESALGIYVYTLQDPPVFRVVNRAMFNPDRWVRGAGPTGHVSPALQACAPYIRFLLEALQRLPEPFIHRGRTHRGVKWVYPSPERHNPEAHFKAGALLLWYDFKSTSANIEVMSEPGFCGHLPGPRTIFIVDAVCAYKIGKLSHFPDEAEVLFPPLTKFRVKAAIKFIVNAMERVSQERSGFPDNVILEQLPDAPQVCPPLSL